MKRDKCIRYFSVLEKFIDNPDTLQNSVNSKFTSGSEIKELVRYKTILSANICSCDARVHS